ncbi:hypothetical protein F5878DRAFT_697780 [Lentinula raphanica]|uniref:Uncharacterized protein n=1 Tax=Lentinula raphanica TaxID=153919 RepID=A0AA38PH49_9AGAR|nr:hypothetical protein F5878DRAFT_697780 [Lentinula raphanica]
MGFPCPAIALAAAFFASSTLLAVQAFSFSATPAVIDSCGNVTLTWTGGSPPFYLLAIPIFGTPRNISIPDSAYQNDIPRQGFGSGGDTQILQMGDASSESCNTTDPGSAFTFQLNAALQQCREFTFEAYTAAIQPVTILVGVIPGGDSFTLSPPNGSTSYEWTADIWNGTTIVFMMVDAEGRQGGTSDTLTVGTSDNSSCINASSPVATTSPIASSANSTSTDSGSSTSVGAIVGGAVGGSVTLAAGMLFALCCIRRRRGKEPKHWIEASGALTHGSRRSRSENIDLMSDEGNIPYAGNPFLPASTSSTTHNGNVTSALPLSQVFFNEPFNPAAASQSLPPGTEITPFEIHNEPRVTHNTGKNSRGLQYNSNPRYILHHDAEDVVPDPEAVGIVELPPQYSERPASQSLSGACNL